MYIESIELKNYRNYNSLALEFDKGTNIFYGDNAKERQIYWKLHIYAVPRNPTGGVRTKK